MTIASRGSSVSLRLADTFVGDLSPTCRARRHRPRTPSRAFRHVNRGATTRHHMSRSDPRRGVRTHTMRDVPISRGRSSSPISRRGCLALRPPTLPESLLCRALRRVRPPRAPRCAHGSPRRMKDHQSLRHPAGATFAPDLATASARPSRATASSAPQRQRYTGGQHRPTCGQPAHPPRPRVQIESNASLLMTTTRDEFIALGRAAACRKAAEASLASPGLQRGAGDAPSSETCTSVRPCERPSRCYALRL